MLKRTFLFLIFAASILSCGLAQACDAERFVLSAGRAFTVASHRGSPSAFSSAAGNYADLRGIALSALGPHRSKLPAGKESEYVRLAQGFIGKFMSRYSSRFNAAGMAVTSCSGNVVSAQAGGRKLIFRVSRRGGGFILQDVNISSIWLVGQLRSTFTGVINRNGGDINALWSYLRS